MEITSRLLINFTSGGLSVDCQVITADCGPETAKVKWLDVGQKCTAVVMWHSIHGNEVCHDWSVIKSWWTMKDLGIEIH